MATPVTHKKTLLVEPVKIPPNVQKELELLELFQQSVAQKKDPDVVPVCKYKKCFNVLSNPKFVFCSYRCQIRHKS